MAQGGNLQLRQGTAAIWLCWGCESRMFFLLCTVTTHHYTELM